MPEPRVTRSAKTSSMRPVPVPRSTIYSKGPLPAILRSIDSIFALGIYSSPKVPVSLATLAKKASAATERSALTSSRRLRSAVRIGSCAGSVASVVATRAEIASLPRLIREKTQLPSFRRSIMPAVSRDLIYCVTRGWERFKICTNSLTVSSPRESRAKIRNLSGCPSVFKASA